MSRPIGLTTHRRRLAAPWLLALYVASGLAAPAAHLAHHRDDHTHGPVVRPSSSGRAFRDLTTEGAQRGHARQRDIASALASHGRMRWPWSAPEDDSATDPEPVPAAAAPHTHGPGTAPHTHATDGAPADAAPPSPHQHDGPGAPASPDGPGGHGTGSAAHFALAVIDAPPPVVLPLPESTRRHHDAPAVTSLPSRSRLLQPTRGPPVLA